ncbi:MAG: fumarate reductase, partial [Sphingomonadales bacterium]|nr:fumarate reductase [Sphingomonadales bacterium]
MTPVSDEAAALVYDVVVIGSGGAGLAAAVIAAQQGLRVAIVEKSHLVGGTTATSGGGAWIPANILMANAGQGESSGRAFAYLRTVIGPSCNEDMIRCFLDNGPDALAYLQKNTLLNFSTRAFSPDYYSDLPDATTSSRGLDTVEYDGRSLGKDLAIVRPARPESLLFGGMAVNGADIAHLRKMFRSPRSLLHALRLISRYAVRRLTYGHDTRLVLGRAMIGRL